MHSVWIWTGGGWHFHHLSCWVMISSSVNYIWRRPDPFQNSEITSLTHPLLDFRLWAGVPHEVDHKGNYVSHEIAHPRGGKVASGPARSWLSAPSARLKGFRHDFHLDLESPASWWHLDFSSRLWESRARSQCAGFPTRGFLFYQGSLRSHKNSSWLFQRAKDWWVQLMPLVMKWWGHGKGQVTIFPLYFG